jgi:hypothetical protein
VKTYSEPEIEQYIKDTLSKMPWSNGKPPINPSHSARFIVKHVLRKEGIDLCDDNAIRKEGRMLGRFSDAKFLDNAIEWSYLPTGGHTYVVSRIQIGE